MNLRAALIDLGNVLVRFDHMSTCRALAGPSGLRPEEVYARLFTSGLERGFDLGEVTEREFAAAAVAALDGRVTPGEVLEAWGAIFTRDEANLALLGPLRGSLRLVLLSNTNPTHFRACEALVPELGLFHARVLSYEVGTRKPEPRIFEHALAAAGVAPEHALFVDDGAEHVAAAEALGIQARRHVPGEPLASVLRAAGLRF